MAKPCLILAPSVRRRGQHQTLPPVNWLPMHWGGGGLGTRYPFWCYGGPFPFGDVDWLLWTSPLLGGDMDRPLSGWRYMGAFSHSARTAPVITVFTPVTALKTCHL